MKQIFKPQNRLPWKNFVDKISLQATIKKHFAERSNIFIDLEKLIKRCQECINH